MQTTNEEHISTFDIDSNTGVVSLARHLDYEKHAIYLFRMGVKVSKHYHLYFHQSTLTCRTIIWLLSKDYHTLNDQEKCMLLFWSSQLIQPTNVLYFVIKIIEAYDGGDQWEMIAVCKNNVFTQ